MQLVLKKSHFYRLFTNARVYNVCACGFFLIFFYFGDVFVIVFTQTCMHVFVDSKFKVHTTSIKGRRPNILTSK